MGSLLGEKEKAERNSYQRSGLIPIFSLLADRACDLLIKDEAGGDAPIIGIFWKDVVVNPPVLFDYVYDAIAEAACKIEPAASL